MAEFLFFLEANVGTCTCVFIADMDNSCMVDKAVTQFSKKMNKVVKECLPKGVYRDFSKNSYIGFSVIQCWRII